MTYKPKILNASEGGTGVANASSSTITLGGALALIGAFTASFTLTGITAVTFPTSGTLATTSQLPSLPISLANGGTSANLTSSNGGIFYSTSTTGAILTGTATARQMLQSGATAAPAWSTATWPATTTINQLLYSSSANTVSGLATANSGILATNSSGIPAVTTASGNWNNTSRSAFLAYANATISGVTGDGTNYTIIFGSTAFDQGSNFNTTTGVFTAPVSGRYFFTATLHLNGFTALTTIISSVLSTSSVAYNGCEQNPFVTSEGSTGGHTLVVSYSYFVNMSANDTAQINLQVSGAATKVVNVFGSGNGFTTFAGYLVC